MGLDFEGLHEGLAYLNSTQAFEEFMSVYKFRGGKYVFKSLFELQNFYYPDENDKENNNVPLLASCDGRGYRVSNVEYQKLLDLKNITKDNRVSREEYLKLYMI